MTNQERLIEALRELEAVEEMAWMRVIRATNDLVHAIEQGREYMSPQLMLELEKLMDAPALKTAWMYQRLEYAVRSERDTAGQIRKALGYGDDGPGSSILA